LEDWRDGRWADGFVGADDVVELVGRFGRRAVDCDVSSAWRPEISWRRYIPASNRT
jgi:hypothetical protein